MSETRRDLQKRKVVVIAASVACMSGGPVLLRNHMMLMWCWLAVMLTALTFAIVELMKLKRMEA